jgi:hypothetical protein
LLRFRGDFTAISHRFLDFSETAPSIVAKRRCAFAPRRRQALVANGDFAADKILGQ